MGAVVEADATVLGGGGRRQSGLRGAKELGRNGPGEGAGSMVGCMARGVVPVEGVKLGGGSGMGRRSAIGGRGREWGPGKGGRWAFLEWAGGKMGCRGDGRRALVSLRHVELQRGGSYEQPKTGEEGRKVVVTGMGWGQAGCRWNGRRVLVLRRNG